MRSRFCILAATIGVLRFKQSKNWSGGEFLNWRCDMRLMAGFGMRLFFLLVLSCLSAIGTAAADVGSKWVRLGPDLGAINTIAVDPVRPNIVYAASFQGGMYKTTDYGGTWATLSLGHPFYQDLNVSDIVIDRKNTDIVIVGTRVGAFKTINGGRNWTPIIPQSAIGALAIDPATSNIIYAGIGVSQYTYVAKSTDGGASWSEIKSPALTNGILAFAISPANSKCIYAITYDGVAKSVDGGVTWIDCSSGITGQGGGPQFIAVDSANPRLVYVATRSGVFRSTEGGANWHLLDLASTSTSTSCLAIDPANPQTIFAVAAPAGIIKSTDGGTSWAAVSPGKPSPRAWTIAIDSKNHTLYAGDGFGVNVSKDDGATWSLRNAGIRSIPILSLSLDPGNSQTIYAGSNYGGFKSTDGGVRWQAIMPKGVLRMEVAPADSRTIYAHSVDGFFKSTDGGAHFKQIHRWNQANIRFSPHIARSNPGILYALNYRLHNVPNEIVRSTDGGETWELISSALMDRQITNLAIDPANTRCIYAGGSALSRSTDGGESWAEINLAIPSGRVEMIAIDPTNSDTIYVGSNRRLYKSSDRGATWAAFELGPTWSQFRALVVAPSNNQIVYAADNSRIFISRDGGQQWTQMEDAPRCSIMVLAVDPSDAETLYVGSFSAGMFKRHHLTH
jgi:BNR/Asp-box repeat.